MQYLISCIHCRIYLVLFLHYIYDTRSHEHQILEILFTSQLIGSFHLINDQVDFTFV
jgi:hypothetical protein